MHDGNPTFRKSQRRTHQIKGNCMFYIHAGFTRAFHAETIFTYDKELDDRPSDQTKTKSESKWEIKCNPPADALYVDYEISRILI